jgi:hypothetical protein
MRACDCSNSEARSLRKRTPKMNSVESEVGKVAASIEALSGKIEKAEGQLDYAQVAGDGEAVRLWLQQLTALQQQLTALRQEKNLLLEKEARLQSAGESPAFCSRRHVLSTIRLKCQCSTFPAESSKVISTSQA